MLRWSITIICLLLGQLVLPNVGFAKRGGLTGSAELMFADTSVETSGKTTLEASHFVQQYSLLWSDQGELRNGRLGTYGLALGYEWNSVDTEINGQQVEINNPLDKLLYRGRLEIKPGGLPFSLIAYSHDMLQTSFGRSNLGQLLVRDNQSVSDAGMITDVRNGQRIATGIKLEFGVQNGHYLGPYRNILRKLPRFMLDYKEMIVHDVKGIVKLDYVDRNLAFISLNKRSNWFHYRRFEHLNYLDPSQDSREDSFLLGSIDHNDRRQWVDFTNWIKVSTDLSYTQYDPGSEINDTRDSNRYAVNFFAKAERTRWSVDNFINYSRIREDDNLEQTLYVPLFARGEFDRNTSWRMQLDATRFRDISSGGLNSRNKDNAYLHAQVETYRQSRYIFRPEFEYETKSGSEGEGQTGRIAFELYSRESAPKNNPVFARYSLLHAAGVDKSAADVSYLQHELELGMQTRLGSMVILGAKQWVVYGTGRYSHSVNDRIHVGHAGTDSGDLFKSISSAHAEIWMRNGLFNRFDVDFEFINSDSVDDGHQLTLTHRLSYAPGALSLSWDSSYVLAEGMSAETANLTADALSVGQFLLNGDFTRLSSNLNFRYSPGRSSVFKADFEYEGTYYRQGDDYARARIDQAYEYTLWHINGRVRKLLVLGEGLGYARTTIDALSQESVATYSVFANYYPTFRTLLSARLRYEKSDAEAEGALLTFLSAGVNYPAFQISLDYYYGHRAESAVNPDLLEQKWEIRVKKTF